MYDKFRIKQALEEKLRQPGREELLAYYLSLLSAANGGGSKVRVSKLKGEDTQALEAAIDAYVRLQEYAERRYVGRSAANSAAKAMRVGLFTEQEMAAAAPLYAKSRAAILPSKLKPGFVAPAVPHDLKQAVEQAGLIWYGLDVNKIAADLPAFPAPSGVLFPPRNNPAPQIKDREGTRGFYKQGAEGYLAWQEFAPEGFPPQPNRGTTYSKSEVSSLNSYLSDYWKPEVQLRRLADAVDQYLRLHLARGRYQGVMQKYANNALEYSPAYFAQDRYNDIYGFDPVGQTPEYVAVAVNKHAEDLATRYAYLVSLLQPGLLDDYRGHPELIDQQYETLDKLPYAYRIKEKVLEGYISNYNRVKLKPGAAEEKAEDLVNRGTIKVSEAMRLIVQSDADAAAREEVYQKKQDQGYKLLYSTLKGYAKPPRLQTLLDACPQLQREMWSNSIRLYYKAPGDVDLTLLLYHDGNQTSLMEKLWKIAQTYKV